MELNNTKYRAVIYLRFSKEEDAAPGSRRENNNNILNQSEEILDLMKANLNISASNTRVMPLRAYVENLRVNFDSPELQIFQRQSARLWSNQ